MSENADRMQTDGTVLGVQNHDLVGEQFLKGLGVPDDISCFCKGHVNAKRYLTYKDKEYHDSKSNSVIYTYQFME